MNLPVDPRQLVLESRLARLENAIIDLTNRLRMAQGIAAEGALIRPRALAEVHLEQLLTEQNAPMLTENKSDCARQAAELQA